MAAGGGRSPARFSAASSTTTRASPPPPRRSRAFASPSATTPRSSTQPPNDWRRRRGRARGRRRTRKRNAPSRNGARDSPWAPSPRRVRRTRTAPARRTRQGGHPTTTTTTKTRLKRRRRTSTSASARSRVEARRWRWDTSSFAFDARGGARDGGGGATERAPVARRCTRRRVREGDGGRERRERLRPRRPAECPRNAAARRTDPKHRRRFRNRIRSLARVRTRRVTPPCSRRWRRVSRLGRTRGAARTRFACGPSRRGATARRAVAARYFSRSAPPWSPRTAPPGCLRARDASGRSSARRGTPREAQGRCTPTTIQRASRRRSRRRRF